ncbi:MAG: aminotransferase class III-fold pyridoxal phosphate-dependent enzyme [Flavisolibacter sp.]|nr:aminotransferase class III-fold pyridoxal phosphate-dependent enzyme [Flavisolibacter sp.]MBD0349773.1 aminotransferase class III-fold pyridoxal phosphate-dependent enzyme [Flavisolibacter sp.]
MIHQLSLKNKSTKKHTQEFRQCFALNRNSVGFNKETKDVTYTLVSDKAEGAFIWDIDGNKYIDLTMGFGSVLFGHGHPPIRQAIEEQLQKSWSVGPISPLAGKLAREICRTTGVERVAFFNSGTEAVMVALRIAKAINRKNYVVFFQGAYHGTFDPLLTIKNHFDTNVAKEMFPGITQSILNESYLLEYGSEESLDFIRKHKDEIAAVLAEPVQSRNPGFQPKAYLQELRRLTEECNIALIFDEVITGFRIHTGGCQKYFNIQADIVTYGKVIGGGLPIGIVAGKAQFLDATDGGYWTYDDDSCPAVKPTFVAGTFCHHPLAMAASLKTLELLNESKGKILCELNDTTEQYCDALNNFFLENGYPFSINYFGSLFRITTPGKSSFIYYQLLLNGVYIWEGRNCFLSPSHTEEVLLILRQNIEMSCRQLVQQGYIKQKTADKIST